MKHRDVACRRRGYDRPLVTEEYMRSLVAGASDAGGRKEIKRRRQRRPVHLTRRTTSPFTRPNTVNRRR